MNPGLLITLAAAGITALIAAVITAGHQHRKEGK